MLIYGIACVKLIVEILSKWNVHKRYTRDTKGDIMGTCLGVYLGEKTIKYAKLEQDEETKKISLSSYGTKYVWGKKQNEIGDIIAQTGSADASVCLNIAKSEMLETEVLKQLKKSDVNSVIALEVSDNSSQMGINEKTIEHRYTLVDSTVSPSNMHAMIDIVNKSEISKHAENKDLKNLSGLYSVEYILNNITSQQTNYILLDVNEKTTMILVSNNTPIAIKEIDFNMNSILDNLAIQEGSYEKACELCRAINVVSEDSLDYKLESIIEPAIQDLLNRVGNAIDGANFKYGKVLLSGLINLFINIDVLFEQYFGIETEKLKPTVLNLDESTINMSEVIEVNEALALAYEGLTKNKNELNFYSNGFSVQKGVRKNFNIKDLLKPQSNNGHRVSVLPSINKEQVEKALLFSNLTAASLLVGYGVFSGIYNSSMTSLEEKLKQDIDLLKAETSKVSSDILYVNNIKSKYVTYNQYISTTVAKIKEGKIGKYTTYNVANFMQKVARYIPSNVELQSIASNDNKTVTLVASSTSYAELGYFISQLKLKGILENVTTGAVEHGSKITVTIGGDLP